MFAEIEIAQLHPVAQVVAVVMLGLIVLAAVVILLLKL